MPVGIYGDLQQVSRMLPAVVALKKRLAFDNESTLADWWEQTYEKFTFSNGSLWCPSREQESRTAVTCLSSGQHFSFYDLEMFSNRIGWWLVDQGLQKGDSIALFLNNTIEFIVFMLACSKVGVVCGLVNYNLRGDVLLHSLSVVDYKLIISSTENLQHLVELAGRIPNNPKLFTCQPLKTSINSEEYKNGWGVW